MKKCSHSIQVAIVANPPPRVLASLAFATLLTALTSSTALAQQSQWGVQFQGRDGSVNNGAAGVPALLQSDVAGVVPQPNWNPIDNWFSFTPNANGTATALWDSNLVSSANVSLTFYASDSWYDDVASASISNANSKLLNGIIKSNPGATPGLNGSPAVEYFQFNNVPEGQYDLYVYTTMNGDGVWADIADNDNLKTYYIKEWHQFTDTSSFVQATNTDPNGVRDTGNYVKLSNLGTYGRGTIGAYVTRRGTAGDGTGVPALQLVPVGPPLANSTPLSIQLQPINRRGAVGYSNVIFSAIVKGPVLSYQWNKNGAAISGETNISYTPAPIASTDNGALISLTVSNNLGKLTSSNAVLTVGSYIDVTNKIMDGGIVTITLQPTNAAAIAGGRGGGAAFSVAATSGYIGDASIGPPPVFYPFAAAAAAPPLSYQWQSAPSGSSSFTPIAGATSATYVVPTATLVAANSGMQFRAAVTASDATVNSSAAVLTVIPNTNPPVFISALALNGSTQVGMNFDEALDPVTSQTASNYKVNGVAVTAAILRTNVANEVTSEQNLVALVTATPITSNFTITISGLKDTSGNAISQITVNGTVSPLTLSEIGSTLTSVGVTPVGDGTGTNAMGTLVAPDPQLPGVVTNWGNGNFDVLAQGNDYWNNADGLDFLWEPKTNSFDVRVQVVSVSGVDNWSAGAIMMREGPPTLNGEGWELARHYFCKVDYGGPTATIDNAGNKGANTYEFNCRLAPGNPYLREGNGGQGSNTGNTNDAGFSYGWGGAGPGNPSPVPFPNAWIRIARVKSATSDHLMGYSGTDGTNWSLREDVDLNDANHAGWTNIAGVAAGPWPAVTYVGLGSVSHTGFGNGNPTNNGTVGSFPYSPVGQPYQAWIVYRNWGDTPSVSTPPTPTLTFVRNSDGTVTLTYTGNLYSSPIANGTYSLVTGAVSPFKVNPLTSGVAATFYRAGP